MLPPIVRFSPHDRHSRRLCGLVTLWEHGSAKPAKQKRKEYDTHVNAGVQAWTGSADPVRFDSLRGQREATVREFRVERSESDVPLALPMRSVA